MFGWLLRKREPERDTIRLRIEGMTCQGCVRHVSSVLKALPGVDVRKVDIGSATVARDTSLTTDEGLLAALGTAGFPASKETSHDTR